MKNLIAVTGSSGFVGGALSNRLKSIGYEVQKLPKLWALGGGHEFSNGVNRDALLDCALADVSIVIHCAARVHILGPQSDDALKAYRLINVDGTLKLARHAAAAGVKRFIFLSSIKVNGEHTRGDSAFTPEDLPDPKDSYAKSKYEAELGLKDISEKTGMEVVIIRPPLIYGPNVKANFSKMINLVGWLRIFPFGAIKNKRSYIFLDNLIDLIVLCLTHSAAANQIFLASDGQDISTPDLVRKLGVALKRKVYIFPVPVFLLRLVLLFIGRKGVADRLCTSLKVDASKTILLLGWRPRFSLDAGLVKTVPVFDE